jgi:hypothetical protein
MEIEISIFGKTSQIEKNRYCMLCLICRVWFLKMNNRNVKQVLLG